MPQTDNTMFPLGGVTMTLGVRNHVSDKDVTEALLRHKRGNQCRGGIFSKQSPLLDGCRVLSAYRSKSGLPFWIITEADHSKTTVLLPTEY